MTTRVIIPHVPCPRQISLIVSPIMAKVCLTKVLMDGGSGLSILYADTLDKMKIPRSSLRLSGLPFDGSS